jgi:hypothetical protein
MISCSSGDLGWYSLRVGAQAKKKIATQKLMAMGINVWRMMTLLF